MADFCPHCNPCRHEGEAQDALLRLASWLGQGPGGGEFTTAEDMEARIREGVNAASQPHKSWGSERAAMANALVGQAIAHTLREDERGEPIPGPPFKATICWECEKEAEGDTVAHAPGCPVAMAEAIMREGHKPGTFGDVLLDRILSAPPRTEPPFHPDNMKPPSEGTENGR